MSSHNICKFFPPPPLPSRPWYNVPPIPSLMSPGEIGKCKLPGNFQAPPLASGSPFFTLGLGIIYSLYSPSPGP